MKSKILILTFLLAGFITHCAKNYITDPDNNFTDKILVKPSVLFKKADTQVSPDNVEKIIVTVIYQSVTILDTFKFADHKGTLSTYIPTNTPFILRIEGIDNNGEIIYWGEQVFSGATKDTTITITADQLTPCAPENLTANVLDSSCILLKWEDKSSNEMGFIIKRSKDNDSSFIAIDTVNKDQVEKIDTTGIKPLTTYFYRIMAYNAAGVSDSIVAKCDPLEFVLAPARPDGDTTIIVGALYIFSTESMSCGNEHPVQYRFDWGDKDTSSWSDSPAGFHSWSDKGTYIIRAQARCSVNKNVVSGWSEGLTITVSDREL